MAKHKFFDFFPAPKYMMLSSEGVALSETAVQFVQFKKGGTVGTLELVHCVNAPLEPGIIISGSIENKEAMVKALAELRTRYGVKYAHATLPEEKVYLFTITLDKVPFKDLRDAVAFTIEDNAPVSLSESIFDYEIIGETEGKNEVKLAVSVLPSVVVESYVAVYKEAGIVPITFDIESQAIARALVPRGDQGSYLIVNLGEKKTGLYVCEDEVVQFSSTTSYGAKEEDLGNLKAEMKKLFAFWNTRVDKHGHPEKRIEKILFTGPGARHEAFITSLMFGIEIAHDIGNVWVNAFRSRSGPDIPPNEALSLAAAVGAALPAQEKDYV